jgi:hypothetical protein
VLALLGDSDDEDEGSGHGRAWPGGRRSMGGAKRGREAARGEGGGARVKPEPGTGARVKREPGARGGGGGGFVDLTKPPDAPLRVGGRVVGADEVAVCDLLDSGDEGGGDARWEVRKRQAVDVDGGGGN